MANPSHLDYLDLSRRSMMKRITALLVLAMATLALAFAPAASAHNRAHVILPSGVCMIVGSEESVDLPDGTMLDLRPETVPADEIGTSFAAEEGNSRLQKGACP
jgi:hypothetical protein